MSGSRPWIVGGMGGMAPRPIMYSEKWTYARANGYARPKERFEAFMRLVAVQDAEYLEWFSERQTQQSSR